LSLKFRSEEVRVPDWMREETAAAQRRKEKEDEEWGRRREQSSERDRLIESATGSTVKLLDRLVSEFCTQTGWKSSASYSDFANTAHWQSSLVWNRAVFSLLDPSVRDQTNSRRKFSVHLVYDDPTWWFGKKLRRPKAWVEFCWSDEYYRHFSTGTSENDLQHGFKKAFTIASKAR
jgi:hypothetical protein